MCCAHFCSGISVFTDTEIWVCVHCSSDTEIAVCAHCSSGTIMFTGTELEICLISDRSIMSWTLSGDVCVFCNSSWWLTGWWSANTLTVYWGEDEDEWSRWWTESLRWVARISPQGSNRFPRYCSALLLRSHFHWLTHPEDSSANFGPFVLQSDA